MTLNQWLDYLEKLHPTTIELGLERIRQVADRLALNFSDRKIITVGGTNGKGSCVTLLSNILQAAGYQCGAYTSPHLLHYNERVRIGGEMSSDADLCEAFAQVEQARGEVSLTYFEFGTLAALVLFMQKPLDYLLLEVGLGGRLDAVNIVDADAAIVTNVALDHMDWLGDSREKIGREKAGIYRAGKPAIYGERDMPASVREQVQSVGARLYRQGEQFSWQPRAGSRHMDWQGTGGEGQTLRVEDLPIGNFAPDNIASILQVLHLLETDISRDAILQGLASASLMGRFQHIERGDHDLLLDVAHNPHAAANLLENLRREYPGRHVRLVIAMLQDKDSEAVVDILQALSAHWYVGEIHNERGCPARKLHDQLMQHGVREASCHGTVLEAFAAAEEQAEAGDVVAVTGSFFTVTAVLEHLSTTQRS